MAWNGLAVERVKTGPSASPHAATREPRESTTAADPRCADSTRGPRYTRARTGEAVGTAAIIREFGYPDRSVTTEYSAWWGRSLSRMRRALFALAAAVAMASAVPAPLFAQQASEPT